MEEYRDKLEKIIELFLLACSTLAILITIGILLSVIFESNRFFSTIPLKVIPSKGDHPHLYNKSFLFTVCFLSKSIITKSAKNPSLISVSYTHLTLPTKRIV